MKTLEIIIHRWQIRTSVKLRSSIYQSLIFANQAGAKLEDAVRDIYLQNKQSRPNHPVTIALEDWLKGLRKEYSFSDIIKGWIPDNELMLIHSAGTDLTKALKQCLEQMEIKQTVKGIILKGTVIPAVLFTIITAIALVFAYELIPSLTQNIPKNAQFIGIGGAVESVANFVRNWIIFIIIAIITFSIWVIYSLPRWTGKSRGYVDRVGPWGIYSALTGVSWIQGLNSLLVHGIKLEDAVQSLNSRGTPWLKERGKIILKNLHKNHSFGKALENSPYIFPDRDVINDLAIASKYQGLEEALELVAKKWSKEIVKSLNTKFLIINIALTVFVVAMIIFFALGMFDLLDQSQKIMKYGAGGIG